MPLARDDDTARRSVVPDAAGRSLWLAAIWTGVGAAIVCATLAIVAVAVCWLPVSGASGHSMSAIRAGLLTFLAAVHGGVTVDGVAAQFLPLGLMIIVGLTAWRAGSGLGDAAASLGEHDSLRLGVAGAAQAASFTGASLVAVPFAALGTSRAGFVGVALASFLLFVLTGGVAFARSSALAGRVAARLPSFAGPGLRIAAAGLAVYFAMSALLVVGSLAVHGSRVEALSRGVGAGWGGVPILLLGLLVAPNALIAGASYLAGPGFAVGTGLTVSPFTTAHGVVPAFPLLGALPEGHGANALVWFLVVGTPLAAGGCVARMAWHAGTWAARFRDVGAAAAIAGVAMLVLAWQGGGGIGIGRLHTVGASPWQAGLVIAAQFAVVAGAALGAVAAAHRVRAAASDYVPADEYQDEYQHSAADEARRLVIVADEAHDDQDGTDKLAG